MLRTFQRLQPVAQQRAFLPVWDVLRSSLSTVTYTYTDEAPMLATHSLLPIIKRFATPAGINVKLEDISVAGRVLSHFPDYLTEAQRAPDTLGMLGKQCMTPEANIIKLPNVSASIPQLVECIAELQSQGYAVPAFPANPTNDKEREIAERYSMVLGSAVNPVLREGNSDRRVAAPVKSYAQNNPKQMGAWSPSSKTHVAHMDSGDFYATEVSAIMPAATSVRIEHNGEVLKSGLALEAGEVIDASFMSIKALKAYIAREIDDAHSNDLMLSLHLKATMMKVSDPIMFGHVVKVFYKDALEKHAALFQELKVNVNNGVGDVYEKVATLPAAQRAEVEADLAACYENRPGLAMVNSARGITNLHVPSDVIIDASMPNVVRDSGMMWNKDDALEDVKCMIPDRSYARIYQAIIEDAKANGQFDPSTMGNVANVGLMAKKAEEYGSHDKTFEITADGTMKVIDESTGAVILEHAVEVGDIWRACQTKDAPIKDWVRLAVSRARATGDATVFWLDPERGHDASIISKVTEYLKEHDTSGLDLTIQKPVDAMKFSCTRARAGQNTISVTGNVLRDYLTDLFPILELGTSAKMLSIVPLLAGGGLYETGAGGSAPKHVEQFVKEGHLRWDSLGEYLATAVSLEDLGERTNDPKATMLGSTLNEGIAKLLDLNKSPSRKVNEIDNRGTNFYVALYWAEALAKQDTSFSELAANLAANEETIVQELVNVQGKPVDIGGYYHPDSEKVFAAMRPSKLFNSFIDLD